MNRIVINEQAIRRGDVRLIVPKDDARWTTYRARLMQREPSIFEFPRKAGNHD